MRDRAWRRSQTHRVIRKRQNIIKNFWRSGDYDPLPGVLSKWNFTCSCRMCSMSAYWSRNEKRHRENARARKLSDYG